MSDLIDELRALRDWLRNEAPIHADPGKFHRKADELDALIQRHGWKPIGTLGADDGMVLLHSPEWIDSDFNPEGVRYGFRNESDSGPVWCASWDPVQDYWVTAEYCDATRWTPLPAAPEPGGSDD